MIYWPSKVLMQTGIDLFRIVRDLTTENSHKVIMGDLNADLTSASDDASVIRRLTKALSLRIVQYGPTHHNLS
ncbi:hypothetical protein TSAR_007138 [Trichomalopsis sarcophagae]|uniref:Endonuclease/exonuclease/phosphatase domain-containing protein n=1 Tax=Trichomalopsis sarcophagae TaxID=543379 RepID=A0A232EPD2_9HYME|nr:hypothetical protein TSAR_007138 [Trichomalopsis sarcophagae]